MNRKYITKQILFGIVLFFTFTSCEKQVVDLEPVNSFSELSAYSTPERVELSVIGAYDAAQCGKYGDSYSRGYPFGAASIIQSEMRGEDMNLSAVFYGITYKATYTTSTANNLYMWETSFAAINRYNTVLKGVEEATKNGVIKKEKGDEYRGELLFLRALTYHNLMIHFALPYNMEGNNNYGLPIYTKPVNQPTEQEEALKIGRSSVKETYAFIIEDLNQAEKLLTEKNKVNSITRASKGAAIALKTRVYLHMREWAKVIEEGIKMVDANYTSPVGNYKLEDEPATPFVSFSNNKESIFSIENNSDDNGDVNGAMSAMMSARTGGRGIISSSPILYNSKFWRSDDKRRNLLYYLESTDYYYCDKYKDPTTRKEYAPIIRYAEILLNMAEAYARNNNQSKALDFLNAVRNRSLTAVATQAYTAGDFGDKKTLVQAIIWERRIEFQGEGRRWEDIHRLAKDDLSPSEGIPAKIEFANTKNKGAFKFNGQIDPAWYSATAKFIICTDKRFIWPIPVNDIIRNQTLAKQQNSGW